jgi:hypothetical protein
MKDSELGSMGVSMTTFYLDAGTGSMMLQALVGGLAGLAVVARVFGARVKSMLFFWRKSPATQESIEDVEAGQATAPPRT